MPIVRLVLRLLLRLHGGLDVQGLEHVPRHGAVLIAPTHQSHADPIVLGAILPRDAWYVATDDLFRIRWLGRIAAALRAFPIRQDTADLGAIRRVHSLLLSGEAIVMFPEGHESPDGSLQPLQPGVAFAALRTGTPIVPVAIRHSNLVMPYASWRPRRSHRPIVVRIGPALSMAGTQGLARHDALSVVLRRLSEGLNDLVDASEASRPEPKGRGIP